MMLIQIHNNGKDRDAQVFKLIYKRIENRLKRNGIIIKGEVVAYITPLLQVMGYSFNDGIHKLVISNKIINSKVLEVVLTQELYRLYLIENNHFTQDLLFYLRIFNSKKEEKKLTTEDLTFLKSTSNHFRDIYINDKIQGLIDYYLFEKMYYRWLMDNIQWYLQNKSLFSNKILYHRLIVTIAFILATMERNTPYTKLNRFILETRKLQAMGDKTMIFKIRKYKNLLVNLPIKPTRESLKKSIIEFIDQYLAVKKKI